MVIYCSIHALNIMLLNCLAKTSQKMKKEKKMTKICSGIYLYKWESNIWFSSMSRTLNNDIESIPSCERILNFCHLLFWGVVWYTPHFHVHYLSSAKRDYIATKVIVFFIQLEQCFGRVVFITFVFSCKGLTFFRFYAKIFGEQLINFSFQFGSFCIT